MDLVNSFCVLILPFIYPQVAVINILNKPHGQ